MRPLHIRMGTKEVWRKMGRKKKLHEDFMATPLKRCLTAFDLTLLGIGHMVGAGIYVLAGSIAHSLAGPGIVISFLLAGIASILAALCYAEFGARVPKAGSAFMYGYVTIGELVAFLIGWDLVLEHLIASASVAKALSGYIDALSGFAISNGTAEYVGHLKGNFLGPEPDFLALAVVLVCCVILATGAKGSANFNTTFTAVNMCVMLLVIILGFVYAEKSNWSTFLPYGWSGVVSGAAAVFYAFVGFDTIAISSEEAVKPHRDVPLATLLSVAVVCTCYILFSSALTLLVPYDQIDPAAAIPDAFASRNIIWAKYVVTIGSVAGMCTTMSGSLYSLPRVLYAMASEGLLFKWVAWVESRTQLPLITLGVCGLGVGLVAFFLDLEKLVEFMSIGTLAAYTLVSACVLMLRYRAPSEEGCALDLRPTFRGAKACGLLRWDTLPAASVMVFVPVSLGLAFLVTEAGRDIVAASWWALLLLVLLLIVLLACLFIMGIFQQNTEGLAFQVPLVPLIPALSILCNLWLMTYLNWMTWLRFGVWMCVGLCIYFFYGIRHSKQDQVEISQDMPMERMSRSKETPLKKY